MQFAKTMFVKIMLVKTMFVKIMIFKTMFVMTRLAEEGSSHGTHSDVRGFGRAAYPWH